jgi:hypothetical protein
MPPHARHPLVLEVNCWVWLAELSREAGRRVTLGEVPQSALERLTACRPDAVWLMGVWERSADAREVARRHSGWLEEFRRALPDFTEQDLSGSPYAVRNYRVEHSFGGDEELAALRRRLAQKGVRLILDFVPNHTARDHPWMRSHPERFVAGDEESLRAAPRNYFSTAANGRAQVFAHGRDPYFDGWPDTVQLDYRRRDTREAMASALQSVAARCDGVRCDMAMLVTREVFRRTWGGEFDPPGAEFWPAAIRDLKAASPNFLMLAEVYWDMEHELQSQGFDYVYDKRLYDRLRDGDARGVNAHLSAPRDFQGRLARFVENHDEPRAAEVFGAERGPAASALTFALPGLRLLHEGQSLGHRAKLPVHLGRRPAEETDARTLTHYRRLLAALGRELFRKGDWRLLAARESWPGDRSHENFVACSWSSGGEFAVVVVNLSPESARCHLPLEEPALAGRSWFLTDALGEARYLRAGDQLLAPGLYLDLPGHGRHLFEFTPDPDAELF